MPAGTGGHAGARPGGLGLPGRLFLTVALVYAIHFAPNVVRETYLAVALGERLTIRVDPYLGLHPDLFEIPGRGAYINNNPGASMLGALPYAIARPAIDLLFRFKPELAAPKPPATYDDPRPNRTRFMNEMRARGLDVRLGLAAAALHLGFNVPLGALAAVLVFRFLSVRLGNERQALWLALLFALGTPFFFRSAFINQNLVLGWATLGAFLVLVPATPPDPVRREDTVPTASRTVMAGLLLGIGLVCDYSAVPLLLAFGLWVTIIGWSRVGMRHGIRQGALFSLGALGPILVLWGYQYAAFGSPWFPAQRYMPATDLSTAGWNGLAPPSPDLLYRNLLDLRYGLLAFCPMLVAALWAPRYRRLPDGLTGAELGLVYGASIALYLFCSSISFAALQWNTGVRYLVPAVPLLFLALVPVLVHARRWLVWLLVLPTLMISWAVAMTRENVVTALLRVTTLGFELPWHTVLRKTASAYMPALAEGGSPLAVFLVTGVLLWLIWRERPA
jgi:hypothetical protein